MADGQVIFEIVGDSKGINQTVRQVTNDIQQESKKWDQAANKATGDIEKSFATMAGNIAGKLAAAGITTALINIGKEAIGLASDLREVQNVVDVTFGTQGAKKIESWAKTAGTQFGLTETQAKKFASTMGAMMKSSGLAEGEILDMSTDLAGLAADMASFYNLDFEEAFSKIRSGMSGMSMPLKELGIDMSVANLNAFALQKGLSKTFEQMTQSEQIVLRYQYLMQATADAQGDFARTSDEYANGMRKLQTNLETIKTKLGNVLVDVVNPLLEGINALFPENESGRHTVLDDFSQIDANTESQLQKITDTAADARDLNNILDEIASNNKGDVLNGLATGANALSSGSVTNWQNILSALTSVNGLENIFSTDSNADQNITDLANALSGSSVDTTKAEAWKTFLGALDDNAEAVSKLTGQSVDDTKTWLSELAAAANTLDEGSAEGWNTLLSSFLSGINLDTPEGNQFRDALAQSFLAMGSESEEAAAGLAALGYDTDMIADKQRLWLETCKRLVETIPGLSEIINTETGEVKGGTEAVANYVDEWEKAQKKMAYIKDLQAKQKALETEFTDFAGLEIDVQVAERRLSRARQALMDQYGGAYSDTNTAIQYNKPKGIKLSAEDELFYSLAEEFNAALEGYNSKKSEYADRKVAYDEANAALQERKEIVEDLVGSLDEVTTAEAGWSQTMVDSATNAVPAATEALKNLADYYENFYDKVKSSVDGVVKGFSKIGKAGDDLREKQQSLSEEYAKTEIEYSGILQKFGGGDQALQYMSAHWEELTDEEKDAYNALAKLRNEQDEVNKSLNQFKPEGMKANLQSQIEFMNEYLDNLEWAKQAGLSDEFLASLSDGSQESAEYLAGLREGGADAAKEVDDLYQQVQEKKKEFTQELTDQQLTVDQTYQNLLDKAKEAIAGLDMEEDAKNNTGKTVYGIIEGISANVPGVEEAVNAVLEQVNRLTSLGFVFSFSSEGVKSYKFTPGSIFSAIPHETGLNYVPFDGYLASLHEGEGILTAEENRVWQRFRNGQPGGMDYDALGGVMRDNVRAGGNVYLDGRTVGRVISDMQGDQYRALQRSGWQQ